MALPINWTQCQAVSSQPGKTAPYPSPSGVLGSVYWFWFTCQAGLFVVFLHGITSILACSNSTPAHQATWKMSSANMTIHLQFLYYPIPLPLDQVLACLILATRTYFDSSGALRDNMIKMWENVYVCISLTENTLMLILDATWRNWKQDTNAGLIIIIYIRWRVPVLHR